MTASSRSPLTWIFLPESTRLFSKGVAVLWRGSGERGSLNMTLSTGGQARDSCAVNITCEIQIGAGPSPIRTSTYLSEILDGEKGFGGRKVQMKRPSSTSSSARNACKDDVCWSGLLYIRESEECGSAVRLRSEKTNSTIVPD